MVKLPKDRPGLKLIGPEDFEGHLAAERSTDRANADWDGFVDFLYDEARRANTAAAQAVEALQALLDPDLMLTPLDAAAVETAIRAYRAGRRARTSFERSLGALREAAATCRRPGVAA